MVRHRGIISQVVSRANRNDFDHLGENQDKTMRVISDIIRE